MGRRVVAQGLEQVGEVGHGPPGVHVIAPGSHDAFQRVDAGPGEQRRVTGQGPQHGGRLKPVHPSIGGADVRKAGEQPVGRLLGEPPTSQFHHRGSRRLSQHQVH